MKPFLVLAPAAVLALLSIASPVSAQSEDPRADFTQLRRELRTMARDFGRIQRTVNHCGAPDPTEVVRVATAANEVSRHAAGLAPRLGGRDHVQALNIRDEAEGDFWYLLTFQSPEVCYQPPAE